MSADDLPITFEGVSVVARTATLLDDTSAVMRPGRRQRKRSVILGDDKDVERHNNFATVRESRDSAMDQRPNDTGSLASNRLGHKGLRR